MDRLQQYLKEQRQALDVDTPSDLVWKRISNEMQQPPIVHPKKEGFRLSWYPVLQSAAVLAALGLFTFIVWWRPQHAEVIKEKPITTISLPKQLPSESTGFSPLQNANIVEKFISPVLKGKDTQQHQVSFAKNGNAAVVSASQMLTNEVLLQMDAGFAGITNLQKERVNRTPLYAESPAYFQDFVLQMRQMDADEKRIKADLMESGMNDRMLEELIQVYQQKLAILKQLQVEMNKLNSRVLKNTTPADNSNMYFLNL